MKHTYSISVAQKRITLYLPALVDESSLIRYIPGSCIEYRGEHDSHSVVDYSADYTATIRAFAFQNYKPYFRNSPRLLFLAVPRFEDIIADLPHLVYAIFRQFSINKSRYPVHSCVINRTMFIGHSGAGKTTLVLEALNRGLQVLSADRSLVEISKKGYTKLLAGTQELSVRQAMVQPDLTLFSQRGDRNIYTSPAMIVPNGNPIEKIVFFKLGGNSVEEQIFQPSIIHQLLPHFMDVEKQHCCITGAGLVFSATHSARVTGNLVKSLSQIQADVFYKEGNLDEILELAQE